MGKVVKSPRPSPLPDAATVRDVPDPPEALSPRGQAPAWRAGWLTGWQAAWQAAMVWHYAVEAAGNAAESAAEPRSEVPAGDSMLAAVERDLSRMKGLDAGVRGSLAALARKLARRLDATGDDVSETAFSGLGQQLRTTLMSLTEVGSDGSLANAFFQRLSTPVRDAADAEPPHVGAAGGSDSGATREAADAVAAGVGRRGARSGARGQSARVGTGVQRRDHGSDAPERKDGVPIPVDDA